MMETPHGGGGWDAVLAGAQQFAGRQVFPDDVDARGVKMRRVGRAGA